MWIRFNWSIFVATADMAGVSWKSTVYGNTEHFTTASFLRNKIKSTVSIFSHYIYTLYLISKSCTSKRESPSSRTRAISMFKYLLVTSIFRHVTNQVDTAVRSAYVTGYHVKVFPRFRVLTGTRHHYKKRYVTTAAFTILTHAHIFWHHLSDYPKTSNLTVVVRQLCARVVTNFCLVTNTLFSGSLRQTSEFVAGNRGSGHPPPQKKNNVRWLYLYDNRSF